jgi:hypothetical protein
MSTREPSDSRKNWKSVEFDDEREARLAREAREARQNTRASRTPQQQRVYEAEETSRWEGNIPPPDVAERKKRTKELTGTVLNRGGDTDAIRGVMGVVNWFLFGGNPGKDRDRLSGADQHKIILTEEIVTDKIKELPKVTRDPKTPPTPREQKAKNNQIVEKAHEGGELARDYIQDKRENGNWMSAIFNPPTVWDEWEERRQNEQRAKAEPEPEVKQTSIWDFLLGEDRK